MAGFHRAALSGYSNQSGLRLSLGCEDSCRHWLPNDMISVKAISSLASVLNYQPASLSGDPLHSLHEWGFFDFDQIVQGLLSIFIIQRKK